MDMVMHGTVQQKATLLLYFKRPDNVLPVFLLAHSVTLRLTPVVFPVCFFADR